VIIKISPKKLASSILQKTVASSHPKLQHAAIIKEKRSQELHHRTNHRRLNQQIKIRKVNRYREESTLQQLPMKTDLLPHTINSTQNLSPQDP
jgi:hypothetical protein